MATRRDMLIAAAVIGLGASFAPIARRFSRFDFRPIEGQPGYREVVTSAAGQQSITFAGLDTPTEIDLRIAIKEARADLDAALGIKDARRPSIVVFMDYNCPACLRLDSWLLPWVAERPDLNIHMRDLPVFGPASERAALAHAAAVLWSKGDEAHEWLTQRTLRPGESALAAFATDIGLDPDRLEETLRGPLPVKMLRETRAVATVLGVIGTPTLMIGRTKFTGAPRKSELGRLVKLEQPRFEEVLDRGLAGNERHRSRPA